MLLPNQVSRFINKLYIEMKLMNQGNFLDVDSLLIREIVTLKFGFQQLDFDATY